VHWFCWVYEILLWLVYSSCYDRLQQRIYSSMRLYEIFNPGLLKQCKVFRSYCQWWLCLRTTPLHVSYWHSWNQISSKYEFVLFTVLWNVLLLSLKLLQLHFLKTSCAKCNFHHHVCTTMQVLCSPLQIVSGSQYLLSEESVVSVVTRLCTG
jgi:hypothetical protein